jgi:hypothetical protein
MKLSFIPGDLHLSEADDGSFVVKQEGREIFRSQSARTAISRFKKLREALQARFPKTEATPEEKADRLRKEIADKLVGHNSLRPRKRKTPSTRTFG